MVLDLVGDKLDEKDKEFVLEREALLKVMLEGARQLLSKGTDKHVSGEWALLVGDQQVR